MTTADEQMHLFDPPREDLERKVGTIRGTLEGLGAGLSVWCGPSIGWRDFGDVVLGGGQATVVRHFDRLFVGISFDLGKPPPLPRRSATPTPDEETTHGQERDDQADPDPEDEPTDWREEDDDPDPDADPDVGAGDA